MQSRRKPQPGDVYQANGFRHEVIMKLPNANPNVTSLLITTRCTRCNTATSTKCLYYRHTDLIHHINGTIAVHKHGS